MADWYAAPSGTAGGDGSIGDPWDLQTALNATGSISAGDTLWVVDGTYTASSSGFSTTLAGSVGNRITIRPVSGGRWIMDGSGITDVNYSILAVAAEANYLDLWFPEFTGTGGTRAFTSSNRSALWVDGGNVRFIHPKAWDCGINGFGVWAGASDTYIYGALIWNTGVWDPGPDGGGHAVYTQNALPSIKTFRHCLFGRAADFSFHAYTESGSIDGYSIEECAFLGRFLIGGLQPVDEIDVDGCHFLLDASGAVDIGYQNHPDHGRCYVTDNVVADGDINPVGTFGDYQESGTATGNSLDSVYVFGSEFDDDHGLVVVWNASMAPYVDVNLSSLPLTVDREYVLAQPWAPHGQAVKFTWDGSSSVRIPMVADWVAVTPVGSTNQTDPIADPDMPARGAFYLAPAATWPTVSDPSPTYAGSVTVSGTTKLDELATEYWLAPERDGSGNMVGQKAVADLVHTSVLWADREDSQFIQMVTQNSNYLYAAFDASMHVTEDLDIRYHMAGAAAGGDINMIDRYYVSGSTAAWKFFLQTNDTLRCTLWDASEGAIDVSSSSAITDRSANMRYRVTVDADVGGTTHEFRFYESSDGESWSQIGTPRVAGSYSGVLSISQGTQWLEIGTKQLGAGARQHRFYGAEVYDGINGTKIIDVRATDADPDAATFTSSCERTVEVRRSTTGSKLAIVDRTMGILSGSSSLTFADDAAFDVGVSDEACWGLVFRAWKAQSANAVLIAKASDPIGGSQGWALTLATNNNVAAKVHDGSDEATDVKAYTLGALGRFAGRIERTANEVALYDHVGDTGSPGDASAIGDLTNSEAVDVGTNFAGELLGGFFCATPPSATDIATMLEEVAAYDLPATPTSRRGLPGHRAPGIGVWIGA